MVSFAARIAVVTSTGAANVVVCEVVVFTSSTIARKGFTSLLTYFIMPKKNHIPLAVFSYQGSEFLFKGWPLQSFITHIF